ncbi:hypothetical protein SNE40_014645 [Patella caerulea]|uniref:Uncharacterized protein n=1 Tax=Patella caerulea TaxID=87958 RepID=A0AAN8JKH7_PATCE
MASTVMYPILTEDYNDSFDFWEWNFTHNLSLVPDSQSVDDLTADLWRAIPLGALLALLCLLTAVGNALVLHAVRTEKRLQSVSMPVVS